MDSSNHLALKRLVVAGFKSIKRIELWNLNNLALFMGRNNAGKSNLLDAFKFLADAGASFERAFTSRHHDHTQVVHRKQAEGKIDFAFDFGLPPAAREGLINELFADNKITPPGKVLDTPFLSTVTLKITVGRNWFEDQLFVSNLRDTAPPCLIFSTRGTPQRTEISYGRLEALCAHASGDIPAEPMALDSPPDALLPFRLRLGRPEGSAPFPVSHKLAERVHREFAQLDWIDPLRHLPSSSPIAGQSHLSPDASNLPDVLHWLHNNKPKQFRRIETEVGKLVPQLGKLYTPTVQSDATVGLIDSEDEDLTYSMDQMSVGTRSLIAVISKVVLAPAGTWICIEEPETYLHPQAQVDLFRFLRDEAKTKRIFIATHSTLLAASCPIESLFIVQRDAANCTVAQPVTERDAHEVIEQLGVKPSFSFEAEAIIFVPEEDDVPVYEAWAIKFGFKIQVQFLAAESAGTLHYFANARIALSKFVHTLIFAVFGAPGQADAETVHARITRHLTLPPDQAVKLEYPELAGYLLNAKTLLKVFPALPLPEAELEARLAPWRAQPGARQALRDLLAEFRLGELNNQTLVRLADALEALPAPLADLFQKIDLRSKPFWKI